MRREIKAEWEGGKIKKKGSGKVYRRSRGRFREESYTSTVPRS